MSASNPRLAKTPNVPTELVADPVVAYRTWGIWESSPGNFFLTAINGPFGWSPDEHGAVTAKCGMGADHPHPHVNCSCGVHAYKNKSEARDASFARGTVQLWGTIVQHERGYRAQYARPLVVRLRLLSLRRRMEIKRSLEEKYHCKVVPFSFPGGWTIFVFATLLALIGNVVSDALGYGTVSAVFVGIQATSSIALIAKILFGRIFKRWN